jgi:hypothetical protein
VTGTECSTVRVRGLLEKGADGEREGLFGPLRRQELVLALWMKLGKDLGFEVRPHRTCLEQDVSLGTSLNTVSTSPKLCSEVACR